MEILKKNVFNIKYSGLLSKSEKQKRTSNIINFIKKNKLISIAVTSFVICLIFNLVLIYNFVKILGAI